MDETTSIGGWSAWGDGRDWGGQGNGKVTIL